MATSKPSAPNDPKPAAASGETAPSDSKKRTPLELVGLIGTVAILIAFAIFLAKMLSTDLVDASADDPVEANKVRTPVAGAIATVTAVESSWRPLRDDDRTDKKNKVLPQVTISATPTTAGSPAFLKIVFYNSNGNSAGDVHTMKVEGDSTETFNATVGITDRTAFVSYKFGTEDRWSIEVLEGADYGTEDWTRLAYFTVSDTFMDEESE